MSAEITLGAAIIVILLVAAVGNVLQRRPHVLKREYFEKRWKDLQSSCKNKDTWPMAVINADKLLDEALKKRRYKGKTMGERLVSAQRDLDDNDAVWFSHKLRNRLVHEDNASLRQKDVKQALVGFRRALKDLGALK
jgi:hypothetical protein